MSKYALQALDEAIDAISSIKLHTLDRSAMQTLVLRLETARLRLDAVSARVLGRFESNGDWAGDASRDAAAWVKNRTGASRGDVVARVRLGRRLSRMPIAAAAVLAGEITVEHVRLLARCVSWRTAREFEADEARLVDLARKLDADRFKPLVQQWIDWADDDGNTPRRELPDELFVSETLEGRVVGKFSLSPAIGLPFIEALRAKTDELFHRDKRMREVDPSDPLLDSPPPARRARALCELVDKGYGATDPERRQAGLTVLVDEKTLAGIPVPLGEEASVVRETLYGSDVPQELLNLWACDCSASRLVITADGVPLDLGREIRTANREQRRALKGRDRGCAVPGCDCSPNWCDAHHLVWWTRGGTTDLANLVMTCRHHHRRIHAGQLIVKMVEGLPRFYLPDDTELVEPVRVTVAA